MNKLELLEKYWGFKQFYSYQEEIIDALIEGEDVMAILPTGAGKSLCYQLPSLLLEGSVLVISPLIALMEDQVPKLLKMGIKAMYFEFHRQSLSINQQLDNCIYGNFKLIYSSPERFLNFEFINKLKKARIDLIAIDEAHCISEWGHDFRPSYSKLTMLRSLFPKTPMIALTASATPLVVEDIHNVLQLNQARHFKASFERPNIAYQFWKTEDKFNTLIQLLNHHKGTSIIYCNTRKQTVRLSQLINQYGHKADYFHGGLSVPEKKEKLRVWKKGKVHHIVATSAFGMGIDKADVRFVIHMQLPNSIERFYQETGRAGRDQGKAHSYLLFNERDPKELKNKFLEKIPNEDDIKGTYKDLNNFFQIAYGEGKDLIYTLDLNEFCTHYGRSLVKTYQTLELFEKVGVFNLKRINKQKLSIQIITTRDHVVDHSSRQTFDAQILEFLIRQNHIFSKKTVEISLKSICKALRCSENRILQALERLKKQEILNFFRFDSNFHITPLVPREDNHTCKKVIDFSKKIYSIKKDKIDLMIKFVKDSSRCKRNALLRYFGEKKEVNCLRCSANSCKKHFYEEKEFKNKIRVLLKTKPHSIQELKRKLYFEPEGLKVQLNVLLKKKYIKEDINNKYHWIYE